MFPDLPDDARLWIYAADRALTEAEQQRLREGLAPFLGSWASHGRRVEGRAAFIEDRFLLLAATIEGGDLSGCGIDASTQALQVLAQQLGFEWLPALHVFYRDDEGQVQSLPRPAFRERVRAGEITASTPVFDPSLTDVGAVRAGRFEQPAGEAWHARVFRIAQPTD